MADAKPPPAFNFDAPNLKKEWAEWVQNFSFYLIAAKRKSDSHEIKIATLLNQLGPRGVELYNTFVADKISIPKEDGKFPVPTEVLLKFDEVLEEFKNYFAPKKNILYERYKFNKLNLATGQSLIEYATALKTAVATCDYTDRNDMVRDRIVSQVPENTLLSRLLDEGDKLTLAKTLELCQLHEDRQAEIKEFEKEKTDQKVDALHEKGYFWHMSDFHWDPNYNEKDGVCRRSVPGAFRSPGPLGEHSCDSPWALIESAVQTMKAIQGDDLEFILWTGDAVSEYLGPEEKMEALKNITDLLSRTFSSQFVFPVLGHTDPREPEKLGQLWRQWLPPDAIQSFNSGGYYMIELKSRRLKVIALNTNLWMETFEDEIDPGGQWNWLDKHLDTAKQKAEIVYLVGHVAPGFDERQGVPPRVTLATRHNTRYHNMIRKYKAVVAGQFFGHLHSDSFRIIYDQQGSPVSTIFLTPAITPKRTSSGTNNPALRLYTFDTDKGQVLNYMQYFMNLTSSNLQGEAVWEEEYNFTRYYGIDEMSPYEMNELAQSFVTQEGIKLFGRYWMANSVHSNVIPTSTRTAWTNSHFCAITQLDSADYQDCLVTRASALAAANSQPTEPSSAAGPVLQINRGFLFIAGLFIFR